MKQIHRSLLLVALLAVGGPGLVIAQDGPPPPSGPGHRPGVERRVDFLAEKLGLTDVQKGQVTEILAEEAKRERKLHEETKAKLDAVLTPEQRQTLATLHPHGRPPGAPAPEKPQG